MKIRIMAALLAASVMIAPSCKKTTGDGDEDDKIIPCIPQHLQADLVALYAFSSGSLAEVSGRGTNLQNPTTAFAVADRNGNASCAYRFGGNDFLVGPNPSSLNSLPGLTVSLWYRPIDSSRNDSEFETLLCRDTAVRSYDRLGQWSVSLYDCRKAVFARHNYIWDKHMTPPGQGTCDDEINKRTGNWHHLAATWNSSGNLMCLYRDGVLQDSASATIPGLSVQDKGDLFIGSMYKGDIDDIFIFKRELSAVEVQQLFALETCCSE